MLQLLVIQDALRHPVGSRTLLIPSNSGIWSRIMGIWGLTEGRWSISAVAGGMPCRSISFEAMLAPDLRS